MLLGESPRRLDGSRHRDVAPWLVHAVLNASTFSVGVALAT